MTRPKPKVKAGTRKITTVDIVPIEEGEPLGDGEPITDFDLSLERSQDHETAQRVLEEHGFKEGVVWRIYKVIDGVQRYSFNQLEKIDEEYIQRERGGGNYVGRLYINDKYYKSVNIPIDDPPLSQQKENANNGNGVRSHEQFLERMLMAMIMRENPGVAAGPSITDLTTALANLDALRGKQESAMETFIKGMEIADRFGSGGGGKLDWKKELFDLGRENMPAILAAVNGGIASRTGNPVPPGAVVPPTVPGQPVQPLPSEEEQMQLMYRQALGMLKTQFMGGLSVESAIDLVLTNRGNPLYQPIIQWFVSTNFDDLVKIDAQIGQEPFLTRFRSLHDGLRSELAEENSVDNDSGGSMGDVVNFGNDGGTSKKRG